MRYAIIGPGDPTSVRFTYDADLVSLLKCVVPSHARKWEPATKTWWINRAFINTLIDHFEALGIHVIQETPPTRQCADWAGELFRAVGHQRINPVHRALTKVLHPDNAETGDTELQRQLNDARQQIERR